MKLKSHIVVYGNMQDCQVEGEWLKSDVNSAALFAAVGECLLFSADYSPIQIKNKLEKIYADNLVAAWGGRWLFDFKKDEIIAGASLDYEDAKCFAYEVLSAFPGVSLSILASNGRYYSVAPNRLAHAKFKDKNVPYTVCPIEMIPFPWYEISVYGCNSRSLKNSGFISDKNNRIFEDPISVTISSATATPLYLFEQLKQKCSESADIILVGSDEWKNSLMNNSKHILNDDSILLKSKRKSYYDGMLGELLYTKSKAIII